MILSPKIDRSVNYANACDSRSSQSRILLHATVTLLLMTYYKGKGYREAALIEERRDLSPGGSRASGRFGRCLLHEAASCVRYRSKDTARKCKHKNRSQQRVGSAASRLRKRCRQPGEPVTDKRRCRRLEQQLIFRTCEFCKRRD